MSEEEVEEEYERLIVASNYDRDNVARKLIVETFQLRALAKIVLEPVTDPHEAELGAELAKGQRIAELLVEHMHQMGAQGGLIPVVVADEKYEITIRHAPVTPESE